MIRKILVATDGSSHARRAVEFACDIASMYAATIYLIHVLSPPVISGEAAFAVEALQKHLEEAGEKIIEEAEREVEKRGSSAADFEF